MSENWKMSDDDVQVPLGVGEGAAAPEPTFAPDKKSPVSSATLLLVGVFLAGLAMIYLLGLQNRPRSAAARTAGDQQTASAIADLLNRLGKGNDTRTVLQDTDKLAEIFYNYPGNYTHQLSDLPGNPFEQPGNRPATPMTVIIPPNPNLAEQERNRKIAESFATLKLQSIMVGTTVSMAMINGKSYSVGSKVGDFTVNEISAERVIVTNGNSLFELKLQRPGAGDH